MAHLANELCFFAPSTLSSVGSCASTWSIAKGWPLQVAVFLILVATLLQSKLRLPLETSLNSVVTNRQLAYFGVRAQGLYSRERSHDLQLIAS